MSPYDRTGEPVDDDPCGCDGGWLDRNADHPRPCLACKPHLAPAERRRRVHGNDTGHPPREETPS